MYHFILFFLVVAAVICAALAVEVRCRVAAAGASALRVNRMNSRSRIGALSSVSALVLVVGLSACGGSSSSSDSTKSMPDVVGVQLDVALSEIKSAGFAGKVDVSGGGTFGVVNEANWQVCSQSPDAGQPLTGTPKVTVDRSCGGGSTETTALSNSTTTTAPSAVTLTVANNADLAALLAERNDCGDAVQQFAAKYPGATIEFDANIASVAQYGDTKTRFDFLVRGGDSSGAGSTGPNFKIANANTFDLNLTGPNIPAYVTEGNKIHIVGKVLEFNKTQCLFFIKPVSVSMR
jgi:hypothetical protein